MTKISIFFHLLTVCTVWAQNFSYEGIYGPQYWGKKYQTCVGKHQSPINIEEHQVKHVTLLPLRFMGFEIPRTAVLSNNGHTVLMKLAGPKKALITGGPLGNAIYVFEQMHFHWGENDWEGSEDKINNHSFAMELHAVFYNSIYKSSIEATQHPDGLTVLAYFLEAGDEADPNYEPLVESLSNVESVEKETTVSKDFILESILTPNNLSLQDYFTYNGSLTTPPCSEVVTWIDFKNPHTLSHQQIAAFRHIRSAEGERVTHNFRPIQPLEDRIVYYNIPMMKHHEDYPILNHRSLYPAEHNGGKFSRIVSFWLIIISSLLIVFNR